MLKDLPEVCDIGVKRKGRGHQDVQYPAGHANPKTTQIYDRRGRWAMRIIVERISV